MRRLTAAVAAGLFLLTATAGAAGANSAPPPPPAPSFEALRAQAEAAAAAMAPREFVPPTNASPAGSAAPSAAVPTEDPYSGLPAPCQAAMLDIAAGAHVTLPDGCAPACAEAGALLKGRFADTVERSAQATGVPDDRESGLTSDGWKRLEDWQRDAVRIARPELAKRIDDAKHAAERLPEVRAACR